jgi:hypothetical protein
MHKNRDKNLTPESFLSKSEQETYVYVDTL